MTASTATASRPPSPSRSQHTSASPVPDVVGRLLVRCPDGPGIVSAVSGLLAEFGANIISLDQYSSGPQGGELYQRTEFQLADLPAVRERLEAEIQSRIGRVYGAEWSLSGEAQRKRVAIMVSKTDHCLLDLLWRHRRGELPADVAMVISNHPDLAEEVRQFGVPYFHVPVRNGDKQSTEREHLRLLTGNVDFVVLARYMQIISGEFLHDVGVPVINIHHSFLPAFIGAGPYQKAKDRGVKLIGATAHYVTEDLDEGPIIEQDVVRVSHADSTRDLMRRGADVERQVLARAVTWHAEDRVIRSGNSTIVFT
ncbi:formyltetrahydrofolate deformylase [Streptomyces sp. NPDC007084]|uniref:formyltetrahydrofolate deformylase n=1 Tax=Streptomyces sp. NPDC007084 TaxID=3154313 RepID=UPI003455222D